MDLDEITQMLIDGRRLNAEHYAASEAVIPLGGSYFYQSKVKQDQDSYIKTEEVCEYPRTGYDVKLAVKCEGRFRMPELKDEVYAWLGKEVFKISNKIQGPTKWAIDESAPFTFERETDSDNFRVYDSKTKKIVLEGRIYLIQQQETV